MYKRYLSHSDAAYHRWGGHTPGLTPGHRSPGAKLVGRVVVLTREVTTAADGFCLAAGTRARVVRATPQGLTLRVGGVVVCGVAVDGVKEV